MSTATSNVSEVEILSPLTIRNITANKEALLSGLQGGGAVSIRIPDDAAVDLCGVQLIESARRQAAQTGVELSLAAPASEAARAVLTSAGFLSPASPDAARFWLHEGVQ